MKHIALLILLLLPCALFAQYPNNPNKIRLGFQTTGNGLTYRGSGAPTQFPTGYNSPFQQYDTVANVLWVYQDSFWYATNTVRRSTPPPYSSTSSGLTLVYGHATWQDSDDEQRYEYVANDSIEAWVPAVGIYYATSAPADIAATPTTGAVEYTAALWNKVPTDSLFRHDGANWVFIGKSGPHFVRGDSGALQDIAEGDTLTITGGYGVNVVTAAGDTVTVIVDTTQIATQYDLSQISTSFVVDADAGTPQTIASGDTLQINSGWGVNTTVGATGLITVTGDSTQVATLYDVSVVQADINTHEAADGDLSATNEIQQIDTFSFSSPTLSISLSSDGVAAKTANLSGLLTGYVTGSGTAGRVPRWTSASALGDGVLRDDGTLLALGGATVSGYSFYDYSTGGWRLATGTTAQRPTNAAGVHRYNTSLGYSETANGSAWLQSDFPVGTSAQTLRHDGTSWVSNDLLKSSPTKVWINNATAQPNAQEFGVAGNVIIGSLENHYLQIGGGGGLGNTFNNATTNGVGRFTVGGGFFNYAGSVFSFTNSARFSGSNLYLRFSTSQQLQSSNSRVGAIISEINSSTGTRIFQWNFAESIIPDVNGNTTPFYVGLPARWQRTTLINNSAQVLGAIFRQQIIADTSSVSPLVLCAMAIEPTFNNNGLTNVNKHGIRYRATTTGTHYAATFNSGLVGIGTETPAQTLHVAGTMRLTGSDGTATALMGRDADGDISAVSEGYGINVTGGALEVDTTQIATQSDLAAISPTTLYTGDGTIATDRTVTVGSDKTLTITSTTPDFPGYSHTKKIGYNATWDLWGDYSLIYTDDYFTNFIQGIIDYDSTVFIRISAGDWGGDNYVNMQMNSAGVLSLTGISGSSSAGLSIGQNTTLGAYGSRLQGAGGVEFDADTAGKFVFQVNNTTEAVIDATGLGINDTSPEKSLDVGGMGKFRQISGQDNSVTIGTNANMGTGRSASVTGSQSSDVAGRFSFTSGTGLTAGEWVTLTWAVAFDNPPAVVLMPEDANGASITPYLFVQPTTTGCSIQVNVTGAPYEGLTYSFNYIVIQGK